MQATSVPQTTPPKDGPQRVGLVLICEGLGDCLFAQAVIRKLKLGSSYTFDLFTRQPALFAACPYVESVQPFGPLVDAYPNRKVRLFELEKLPHWKMDTFDFISVPLGLGQLSFREKQLEYFAREPDSAERFDVVLNTSMTWATRSWPLALWQRLADAALARGLSVAVVGKDARSEVEKLDKRSPPLARGVRNLVNQLSLDQTWYTLRKAGLFVSGQNGLSVLAGATDTEIIVLGSSIEWSKRAIYRNEDPHHKVTYVRGGCEVYCGHDAACPLPENRGELKCVPPYEAVEAAMLRKLPARA